MRIALTMRVTNAAAYSEPRDAISHDWIRWLGARGHQPVLIPNRLEDPAGYAEAMGVDALILTGGNDVVPRPGHESSVSEERTRTEERLFQWALDGGRPVLGACRGLHVINRFFGGTIESDISGGPVQHVAASHRVRVIDGFMAPAGSSALSTNSYHDQGVRVGGLAELLRVFALSHPDDLVEGLYHPVAPVLAVQWHPERPNPAAGFDDFLIGKFLAEGMFWRT